MFLFFTAIINTYIELNFKLPHFLSSALDFLLDGWKVLLLLNSIHFEALSGQYSQSKSYLIRCWYLVVFFFRKLSTVIDFILASALFGQMLRSFDMLWGIYSFRSRSLNFRLKTRDRFQSKASREPGASSKSNPSLDSVRCFSSIFPAGLLAR